MVCRSACGLPVCQLLSKDSAERVGLLIRKLVCVSIMCGRNDTHFTKLTEISTGDGGTSITDSGSVKRKLIIDVEPTIIRPIVSPQTRDNKRRQEKTIDTTRRIRRTAMSSLGRTVSPWKWAVAHKLTSWDKTIIETAPERGRLITVPILDVN